MSKVELINGILDGSFILSIFVALKFPSAIYVSLGIACTAILVNVIETKHFRRNTYDKFKF